MSREEKIETIADILETELEDVTEERLLEEFDTWDSVAVLGVISAVSEETGHYLHADEIRQLKTIGDLFDILDAK
ncbi:MAG: hypothetical protein NC489_19255 [Ruminococcus flavefaciens]|nr:hypothetical protein [Ruminococcus flavefaciens]